MRPVELRLESTIEANRAVVDVTGELDLYTAPKLRERLAELTAAGYEDIVLDCSDLTFMDSTGLGVLIGHLKRGRERGIRLALVGLRPQVEKVLRVTGVDKILPIYPTREEALRAADGDREPR